MTDSAEGSVTRDPSGGNGPAATSTVVRRKGRVAQQRPVTKQDREAAADAIVEALRADGAAMEGRRLHAQAVILVGGG